MIKILAVEDEAVSRDALVSRLRNILGTEGIIEPAEDGNQAIRKAVDMKPQLILMDIEMPFMNGLEAAAVALGDALGSDGMILDNNIRLISAWVSNSRLQRFENGATKYLDTLTESVFDILRYARSVFTALLVKRINKSVTVRRTERVLMQKDRHSLQC